MFYLNRVEIQSDKYFVTDSKDNIEECLSKSELIRALSYHKIQILGCHIDGCNLVIDKVYKKNNLYVYCIENNLIDIIDEYIDKEIDFCKLSLSSNRKVLWKCKKCNGVWSQSPNIRFKRGIGSFRCPYCSGNKVLKGLNDLETTHSYLKQYWDFSLNTISFDSISSGSVYKAFWLCPECNCSFKSPVSTMTRPERKGLGCPDCAASRNTRGTSYNEQYIFDFLSQYFTCKNRAHFDTYEFDVYVKDLNVLIEYDGEFWHSDEKKIARDFKKNEVAKDLGFSLIRIREGNLPALNGCINIFIRDFDNLINNVCIELLDILTNRLF